jgi:cyclohexa-1,5-dienecarbonyl-CoA hydratase
MATGAPVRSWRDRDGRLLRIRLDRPKANVLDAAMVAALDAAFAAVTAGGEGPALRGVLLDAEGPHFSFGASVEEHLPATCAAMLAGFHGLLGRMLELPVPILVAVKGQCLGGGLELASAGHLLFTAPDARLAQPEILLGVFAPAASCLLPERIGPGAANDLLLSGRSIDGTEAHRLGLACAVAADPEAAALAWFDTHLAGRSATALGFAVRAAQLGLAGRVRTRLAALETIYLEELMSRRDPVEGLTAFIEKRPARWEDR